MLQAWRQANQVDQLLTNPPPELAGLLALYRQAVPARFLDTFDKCGRPIYVIVVLLRDFCLSLYLINQFALGWICVFGVHAEICQCGRCEPVPRLGYGSVPAHVPVLQ